MTIVHLDLLLEHIYKNKGWQTFEEIRDSFNTIHSASSRDVLIMLNKLEKDGYVTKKESLKVVRNLRTNEIISETKKPLYFISFEGVLFIENAPFIWKNQPYRWNTNKESANTAWKILKISMVVINALIIIYLTYLQAIKN